MSAHNVQAQFYAPSHNPFYYACVAHTVITCPIQSAFTATQLAQLEASGCVVFVYDTGATNFVTPGIKSMHSLQSTSDTVSGVDAVPVIGTGVLQLHLPTQLHASASLHDIY